MWLDILSNLYSIWICFSGARIKTVPVKWKNKASYGKMS